MSDYRIRDHLGEIASIALALAPIVAAITLKLVGAV